MTIAIGQFTITDFNDINISKTEPISPVLDMLWLDTSATPYTLKSWNGVAWVASRALSLAELDAIQDAKLNTRITTFYQPTVPTSTAVGDFWVDTSNNNHLYRAECIGADDIADGEWVSVRDTSATEALDDFVDAVFTPGVSNLQDQIDGKIETWFQEDDPNTWLEEERSAHNNDRWFKPSTQALKKYIASTNTWETIDDALAISAYIAAATAQDTADGKRRVFTTQPDPPYDVGDLWSEGSEGDLKRCKTAKDSEGVYSADDWEPASDAVRQGVEYNKVTITATNGVMCEHDDDSYTKMTADGLERYIPIPQYSLVSTGTPNTQGFEDGVFPSDWVGASDVSVSNAAAYSGSYGLLVNGYGTKNIYSIQYITDDNAAYSFYYNIYNLGGANYEFYIDGELISVLTNDQAWHQISGVIDQGYHVFLWKLYGYTGNGIYFYLDDVVFEADPKELTEIENVIISYKYNYRTYVGVASTFGFYEEDNEDENFVPDIWVQLPPDFANQDFNVSLAVSSSAPTDEYYGSGTTVLQVLEIDTVNAKFKVRAYMKGVYVSTTPHYAWWGFAFQYTAQY